MHDDTALVIASVVMFTLGHPVAGSILLALGFICSWAQELE